MKVEKGVADPIIVSEGILSKSIEAKELKVSTLIVHESLLTFFYSESSREKSVGFIGIDELARLKVLLKSGLRFSGRQLRNETLPELSLESIRLANDESAIFITSSKESMKTATAMGVECLLLERQKFEAPLKIESFFDPTTMSVHLKENVEPFAKKGVPGNWQFVQLRKEKILQSDLKEISREIIESPKSKWNSYIEIERAGSTIVQMGNYRIVITRPPFSDGWEITAVRPVRKMALSEYKMDERLLKRISEEASGILIAGPPGSGKCLDGNEIILTDNLKPITAKNFYNSANKGLLSINKEGRMVKDTAINKAKRSENKLLTIITRTKRRITVTEEHPLLVIKDQPRWIPAKEIKPNDKIAILRHLRVDEDDTLSFLEYYNPASTLCELTNAILELPIFCRFYGAKRTILKGLHDSKSLEEIEKETKCNKKYIRNILGDLKRENIVSGRRDEFILVKKDFVTKNNEVILLEDVYNFKIPLDNVSRIAVITNKTHFITLPKEVSPPLCKFFGYYYSEGGGDKLSFTNTDQKLIKDFKQVAKESFGIDTWKKCKIAQYVDWYASIDPIFRGFGLSLKERKKSINMKLPDFLLRCSLENLKAFLASYFDGDGGISKGGREIEYYTSSEEAAHQIVVLLLRLGIFSTMYKKWREGNYRYTIIIFDKKSIERFEQNIFPLSENKQRLIKECLNKVYSQTLSYDLGPILRNINRYLKIKKINNCSIERLENVLIKLYQFYYEYSSKNELNLGKIAEIIGSIETSQQFFNQNEQALTWNFLKKNHIDRCCLKEWTKGRTMKISTLNKISNSLGSMPIIDTRAMSQIIYNTIKIAGASISTVSKEAMINAGTVQLRIQNGWECIEDIYKIYNALDKTITETKEELEKAIMTIEIMCKKDILFDSVVKIESKEGQFEVYDFETTNHNLVCGRLPLMVHNSTIASALAEYYSTKNKIVKTIEAPRDLQLPENITQYASSHASPRELNDIMLLSRPDYSVFDEMRNTRDFKLYIDLRLAGIGLAGVVHATKPIDAIQRFISRTEIGVIPQIIDTIIFISKGGVEKTLGVSITVKVPTGMTEADLARPVVEVRDFLTKELEYEIYTFGEQTVVLPVKGTEKETPMNTLAKKQVENAMLKYTNSAEAQLLSNNKAVVYVPERDIAKIIGEKGKNIEKIEREIGISLDVRPTKSLRQEKKSVPYTIKERGNSLLFITDLPSASIDAAIDGTYLFTSTTSKKGEIKISKNGNVGKALEKALDLGKKIDLKEANGSV